MSKMTAHFEKRNAHFTQNIRFFLGLRWVKREKEGINNIETILSNKKAECLCGEKRAHLEKGTIAFQES
ncbi:MAG: hypothetical protein ACRCZZ_06655, partial [Phocaeicola sp.]